jgi:hypothetical protein
VGTGGGGETYPFFFLGEGLLESESLLGGITLVGSSLLLPDLLQDQNLQINPIFSLSKRLLYLRRYVLVRTCYQHKETVFFM